MTIILSQSHFQTTARIELITRGVSQEVEAELYTCYGRKENEIQ